MPAAISERTKAVLGKAKGRKVGGDRGHMRAISAQGAAVSVAVRQEKAKGWARDLLPVIIDIRATGAITLQAVADALNDRGIPTARGGQWSPVQVRRSRRGPPDLKEGSHPLIDRWR